MKVLKLFFGFWLFTFSLFSQDRLGLANSNYMPVTTNLFNPSSIVDSYTWLDINAVGASLFFHNNYLYIPASQLAPSDRFTFNFSFDSDLGQFDNSFDKNISADATVFLPSASLVLGRSSVAINATSRNVIDIRNFPAQVAKGMYTGFQNATELFGEKIDADNMKANQLSWLEAGASFGTFVYTFDEHVVTAGISIKKLWGINGFAAKVDDWDYTTEDLTTMRIHKFKGEVASASGFGSGKGYSGDLGITYKRFFKWSNQYRPNDKRTSCNRMPYRYKLMAAIVDLGSIKFTENATLTTYTSSDSDWNNYTHNNVSSASDIANFFSTMGGSVQSAVTNSFSMGLPTAITAAADYNLGYGFYAGANTVIGLPSLFLLGPQRPFQLAVMPRFESRFFEMSIPVSTINFQDVRLGLMMRLGWLTIGTDRLNTFLFGDVYAADVFVLLKLPFYTAPQCKEKKSSAKKAPFCPKFR